MQSLKSWKRLESEGLPIYINPEKPDWFVPGASADIMLRQVLSGTDEGASGKPLAPSEEGRLLIDRARIFSRLESEQAATYEGRHASLELTGLKECWFHLTDACNLSCRHCLFAASPGKSQQINFSVLQKALAEARGLGCTVFYFTGGEPFVYPKFADIVTGLLQDPAVHVVVLTNGLLLEKNRELLQQAPPERLHLQISLDGLEKSHDALRGPGSFARLLENIHVLQQTELSVTLSVAVNRENIQDLQGVIDIAAENGVKNIHLLWHFVRGKGCDTQFIPPAEIWHHLRPALEYAEQQGVTLDNVETIRAQVFSTPGTRYDLSNSGWESIAVGPDGTVYPSPALVGIDGLRCGSVEKGLEQVWHHSAVLAEVRKATLAGSNYEDNPLKFLIGGGDIDHSYIAKGVFSGHDPYVELYNDIALWLIARQAKRYPAGQGASLLLKMGDVRHDCQEDGQQVALTHCNCVISLSGEQGHASVREFYGQAATDANEDIVNPFAPEQAVASFIPQDAKKRSYGCGSPVSDAQVKPGETVVDLGSGSGVECFQAAQMVGDSGRVFGIDMTDEMLALARSSKEQVVSELGYDNIEFKKGFLEAIPLADSGVDLVISNCVINLSPDKRQTLHEAYRILKPGGRLVVSDIVTDEQIPVQIKNDQKLRGECLGGAMQQEDLIAMLEASGFASIKLLKRFPYRQIDSTSFYSLTFVAYKPGDEDLVEVVYRGPFAAVYTESGELLLKGKRARLTLSDAQALDDSVFILDKSGAVVNIEQAGGCCGLPPEQLLEPPATSCCPEPLSGMGSGQQDGTTTREESTGNREQPRQHCDCMVCGGELRYFTKERELDCFYCGEQKVANASCHSGHFVCDSCHQHKGVAEIKKICTEAAIEDMVTLMQKIRSRRSISMHGPEHHAMVPGIILSTYRARGGKVGKKDILTAIERGSRVPGGVCGFWGNCGAAAGAGIGFSVILEATPLTAHKRQIVQGITSKILEKIASFPAARCCQRETLIALQEAARLSEDMLSVSLVAEDVLACSQYPANRECIKKACPFWETRDMGAAIGQPLALVI